MITPGLHPKTSNDRKPLSATSESYFVPLHIDRRFELLPTSDQVVTNECVAYTLAGWLEYHRWKNEGISKQINPAPIYKRAKEIDGINGDGTSLEAGLQAIQDLGLVSPNQINNIKEVYFVGEVRRAIHQYGVVLGAFNITDKWQQSKRGGWIEKGGQFIGGHAVLLCGYSLLEKPNYFSFQNSWGQNLGWKGFNRIDDELFKEQFQYGLVFDYKV